MRAPRPVATMIDIGVASPNAHGHAMINTATAAEQRVRKARIGADVCPNDERQHRNGDHGGNEYRGDAVREPLHRRATALRICHERDDPREQRFGTDFLGKHRQRAGAVDGCAGDARANRLFHRHRFAAQHRFVHRAGAVDHATIDRDLLAGSHQQPIADADRIERHLFV